MKHIVYGLTDPRNNLVYYVGRTSCIEKRSLEHLRKNTSETIIQWIESLEKDWVYPEVTILEEVKNINDLPERETHWINYYKLLNPGLLNKSQVDESIIRAHKIKKEDMDDFQVISRRLSNLHEMFKKQRLLRGVTQDELAKVANMSRSTLSLFERGETVSFETVISYNIALKAFDMKNKIHSAKRVRKSKKHDTH